MYHYGKKEMDLDNVAIAAEIGKLADLLEFSGANSFKIRAYRNGARVIKDFPDSFTIVLTAPTVAASSEISCKNSIILSL
jgi:DNA polymerase/3'-5' exonuclease PolX